MPHFYTHVCTSGECARDPEGQQYPDLATACRRAREEARSLVAGEIAGGSNEVDLVYWIDNENGDLQVELPITANTNGLI